MAGLALAEGIHATAPKLSPGARALSKTLQVLEAKARS